MRLEERDFNRSGNVYPIEHSLFSGFPLEGYERFLGEMQPIAHLQEVSLFCFFEDDSGYSKKYLLKHIKLESF